MLIEDACFFRSFSVSGIEDLVRILDPPGERDPDYIHMTT